MKGEKLNVNWKKCRGDQGASIKRNQGFELLKFAATKTNINRYLPKYKLRKRIQYRVNM